LNALKSGLSSVILFCKAKNTSNDLEMADFPPGPNPSDASDWDSVQEPEPEQAQNDEPEQAQNEW
jgi:hypothetical protein